MPIYEYACKDCGHAFEALVRSDTVPECPQCHSTTLEKQLSVFSAGSGDTLSKLPPSACAGCPNLGGQGACGLG